MNASTIILIIVVPEFIPHYRGTFLLLLLLFFALEEIDLAATKTWHLYIMSTTPTVTNSPSELQMQPCRKVLHYSSKSGGWGPSTLSLLLYFLLIGIRVICMDIIVANIVVAVAIAIVVNVMKLKNQLLLAIGFNGDSHYIIRDVIYGIPCSLRITTTTWRSF